MPIAIPNPGIVATVYDGTPAIVGPIGFTNLDAEAGSMSGWTTTGSYAVRTSGSGYPAARTGTYYFYPGTANGSTAYQNHTCTSDEIATIDAGAQWIDLTHYVRGVEGADPTTGDCGQVVLKFYDGSASLIGTLGPPAPFAGPRNLWAEISYRGQVPVGTRTIRLHQEHAGFASGISRDFYVDDISVNFIAEPAASEVWFTSLDAEKGTWGWVPGTGKIMPGYWGASYPPYEGSNYFTGTSGASHNMTQTIAVDPSRYAAIDAGALDLDLTWRERFYGADQGQLVMRYLDASDSVLGTLGSSLAGGSASWTLRSFSGTIPADTRKLQLYIGCSRVGGGSICDYYVDAITAAYS